MNEELKTEREQMSESIEKYMPKKDEFKYCDNCEEMRKIHTVIVDGDIYFFCSLKCFKEYLNEVSLMWRD
jgi:hypothetical protein